MVLSVVEVLLVGGLVWVNDSSLGWIINENVNHDISMTKNHGFGFSCGISLRRGGGPLSLA